MYYSSPHSFHIPVMGLAYTIDTPIKVARFGISSVISIIEDRLVEMMRKHYYPTINQEYHPISTHEEDYRAKRITDYLNLVNKIVKAQVEILRNSAFETGSEIVKYFEMLPDDSSVKQLYLQMLKTPDHLGKKKIETQLRSEIKPGSIDVNIMTKTDRDNYNKRNEAIPDGSDAVAALRGYANCNLSNTSVVFSAGLNPRLYNYLGNCKEFEVNEDGAFSKKVVVKVSDYRSALIQGKYLAKKGIWISEFRIESGLNCGGHAFASEGYLLGPILEEFKLKRQELVESLFEIYSKAIEQKVRKKFLYPPALIITVQGGIGTNEEADFLRRHYNIKSTGWGTPFLLVPEATTVDEYTLQLLSDAKETDVVLSRSSPLGVRFYNLKGTSAEKEKTERIIKGKPGSPCTEKHLGFNTEFTTEPICTASHKYQKLKIAQIETLELPEKEYKKQLSDVLEKECLCVGLSNSAAITYAATFIQKLNAVSICPGPNIANFSKVVSLQTMIDHIYGRDDIINNAYRPHMFITELRLYIDYLKEELEDGFHTDQLASMKKHFTTYYNNLKSGISYYYKLPCLSHKSEKRFINALNDAELELQLLSFQYPFISQ